MADHVKISLSILLLTTIVGSVMPWANRSSCTDIQILKLQLCHRARLMGQREERHCCLIDTSL